MSKYGSLAFIVALSVIASVVAQDQPQSPKILLSGKISRKTADGMELPARLAKLMAFDKSAFAEYRKQLVRCIQPIKGGSSANRVNCIFHLKCSVETSAKLFEDGFNVRFTETDGDGEFSLIMAFQPHQIVAVHKAGHDFRMWEQAVDGTRTEDLRLPSPSIECVDSTN